MQPVDVKVRFFLNVNREYWQILKDFRAQYFMMFVLSLILMACVAIKLRNCVIEDRAQLYNGTF